MISNSARGLITVATIWYGFVPLIADLNPSHLFNPNWTPHARMHLTWLLSTNFLLAMYALYLLWGAKEVLKAGLLGLCVVGGFWVATLTRDLYGGMLVDPDLSTEFVMGLNPNIVANILVVLLLGIWVFLQSRAGGQTRQLSATYS
jgi:hypothetical protein